MTRLSLCRRVVALCGLVCFASCGSGTSKPPTVKVDEKNLFCTEVAEVVCFNMFKCCTGAAIEKVLGLEITTTEETCRRDVTLICKEKNYQVLHAIGKGTVKIKNDIATACLSSYLVGDNCFVYSAKAPWVDACQETAYEGLVETGGACDLSVECATDSYCAPDKKCRAYGQAGESCATQVCAVGLYCNYKDTRCAAPLGENQVCSADSQCAKDLYCDMKMTTLDNKCRRRAELGAVCAGNNECVSGYCIPGLCTGTTHACFRKEECGGKCEGSTTMSCTTDSSCGTGKCSSSGYSCYDANGCGTGDTCVFPKKCLLSVCEGNPVCGERFSLVDYCEEPLKLVTTTTTPTPQP